jgi:methionyl-tRNA formyltransferase
VSLVAKLRVHFVTEDDPLYVVQFFETFLSEYPRDAITIVGVTIQQAFNESRAATAKRVFSLYGSIGFARLLLRVMIRKLQKRSIVALVRKDGIPLVPAMSVNDSDFVSLMRESKPDVIVSVAAPEIFKLELLETPRLGCINVHSGRLPRYRGMMPAFWQMRFGEPHATVTVHEMAPAIDAGAVLGTAECPIRERDSVHRVMIETKREAARLMIRVLRELAAGRSTGESLDMANASYYSFPVRSDARSLRKRGHRML